MASFISSEGSVSGLKAHEKRSGSGLILILWSERRVWLNNVSEQPGLIWILEVVPIRMGWWGGGCHFCRGFGLCGGRVTQPDGQLLTLGKPFSLTAFFLTNNSLLLLPGIGERGTKARAFKVGAKNLVALTEKNMIALDATGKVGMCQEFVTVQKTGAMANGNKVSFHQQVQSILGWAGGHRV